MSKKKWTYEVLCKKTPDFQLESKTIVKEDISSRECLVVTIWNETIAIFKETTNKLLKNPRTSRQLIIKVPADIVEFLIHKKSNILRELIKRNYSTLYAANRCKYVTRKDKRHD